MRNNMLLTALLAVLTILAAGCGISTKETDQTVYVAAMGIDKAENGKIKVTYRTMISRAVSGPQGAPQEVEGGPNIASSFVADNTAEALELFKTSTSRNPNLNHIKVLLISEEVARSGVGEIIAPLLRYREYRSNIYVNVVRGKAEDWMMTNQPKLDYVLSKFWESFMASADISGYYTKMELHDFYLRLKNPGGSAYANYIGINPMTGEGKPADEKSSGDRANAYLPGDIPRTGTEDPVEFAGAALFSGDKMVGTLNTRQARILHILQNKFSKGFLIVSDPLEPEKTININMHNGSKPEIKVDIVDGKESIKVKVFLEGEITGISSGIHYEVQEQQKMLEKQIAEIVTEEIQDFIRYTQSLGSDVVGFGYYLRSHYDTYDEMSRINLQEVYRNADAEVQVSVQIRRTGLMWRTSPYISAGSE